MEGFPTFKGSWPWVLDLDLESGHTAYRSASLIDLYLRAKFHWNRRNFLWTDRHITDWRTFDTHFIRSAQKNWPNNWNNNKKSWCVQFVTLDFLTELGRQIYTEYRDTTENFSLIPTHVCSVVRKFRCPLELLLQTLNLAEYYAFYGMLIVTSAVFDRRPSPVHPFFTTRHRRTQDFTMEGVTLVDTRVFCLGVTWRARSASI